MWYLVQKTLLSFLADFKTDGAFMWSQAAGKYVSVGNTFDSYEYGGNEISFKVDRTFSREYGYEKAFAVCLDLTADKTSAQPPIGMYTLKGGDFISNKIAGVGGLDGVSSGVVSTPVAGSKLVNMGLTTAQSHSNFLTKPFNGQMIKRFNDQLNERRFLIIEMESNFKLI